MKLNKKGQALVEYLLIIGVISVIVVSLVVLLGGYLTDSVTKSSCTMMGKEYVSGEKPGEGTCEDKKPEEKKDEKDDKTSWCFFLFYCVKNINLI